MQGGGGPCCTDHHVLRCAAVADPPVNRLLRRPQSGDRLTSVTHVLELRAHQAPEDPAATMRRQHADEGHACARQLGTRDSEAEGERTRRAPYSAWSRAARIR